MKKETQYLEDAAAKEYESHSQSFTTKQLKSTAKTLLSLEIPTSPKRLLVVGLALGGAREVCALNKYFPDYKVYGIDLAKSALLQKLDAELVVSDVTKMPFKDNFFSGANCIYLMHEVFSYSKNGVKNTNQAFSEISRTLAKGGILVIEEFFVPDEKQAKLKLKTKEAIEFAKRFIKNFRKEHDESLRDSYKMKGDTVSSTKRLLYELILHFRVAIKYSKSFDNFFNSKEIEEQYLPLSLTDYFQISDDNNLEIAKIKYKDYPEYSPLLEKYFTIFDKDNKKINFKFGSMKIAFRKI